MKKIFNAIFMSAVIVAATTSCNKDDSFDSNVTTTPSGYVSEIKYTFESTNYEEVKEYETVSLYFTYDAKKRVKTVTESYIDTSTYGTTVTTNSEASYSYDNDLIYFSSTTEVITKKIVEYEILESTSWYNYYVTVELDGAGVISKRTEYYSDGSLDEYFFDSMNGDVITITRKLNGKDDIYNIALASWQSGNVYVLGDDYFQFSTLSNDCNIDLNMFITNSEEISREWGGEYIGFLTEIKGIHSANMISSCEEEGYKYDILYVTDSKGRVIQAKWDKSGKGNYSTIDVSYY